MSAFMNLLLLLLVIAVCGGIAVLRDYLSRANVPNFVTGVRFNSIVMLLTIGLAWEGGWLIKDAGGHNFYVALLALITFTVLMCSLTMIDREPKRSTRYV